MSPPEFENFFLGGGGVEVANILIFYVLWAKEITVRSYAFSQNIRKC